MSRSSLTEQAEVSDLLQRPPQVAARLEAAPVGIDVHVANRLLDPDTEAQRAPREGVQDVHKVGIVGGKAPVGVHPLKVGTGRVQTCGRRHKHLIRTRLNVPKTLTARRSGLPTFLPVILPTLLVAWLPANPATWAPRL